MPKTRFTEEQVGLTKLVSQHGTPSRLRSDKEMWRKHYNEARFHSGLLYQTPIKFKSRSSIHPGGASL